MEADFIAHGLPHLKKPSGDVIIEALQSDLYHEFIVFSAFVSVGGIKNVIDAITHFKNHGGQVSLFVGVDLHATSKEALRALLDAGISTKIVYSPNSVVYHPKVYLFRGDSHHLIIVGSSNLTASGLFQNIESSICLKYNGEDEKGMAVENSLLSYFQTIIDGTSGSVRDLNEETLSLLESSNVVLSEGRIRASRRKMNDDLPDVPISTNRELNDRFKRIKVARPPKGHRRSLRSGIITPHTEDNKEPTISVQSLVIDAFSMWIESGQMTGGSRNILDLSKKGRRAGLNKFGSVEFFGIDKNSNNPHPFDVSLVYGGQEYIGNSILYAEGNSNWRIQLRGITASGERLTDILRESGSQGKVFVFEKTDVSTKYIFHILDVDAIEQLIDLSSDWAAGGNGQGRRYGLLNGIL